MNLTLNLHQGELSIVRLSPQAVLPAWLDLAARPLVSVTFAANELSIVCPTNLVPPGHRSEGPWRAFEIEGPIDFALTGVLASVLHPLAAAGLSIFALSTYDTDWALVRSEKLATAQAALRRISSFARPRSAETGSSAHHPSSETPTYPAPVVQTRDPAALP